MGRSWVLVAALISAPVPACVEGVRAGLANAPALGSTGSDPGMTDVIANGPQSCGRTPDPGAPRWRSSSCPRAPTVRQPPAAQRTPASDDVLVLPWLEHYYDGFPCPAQRPHDAATALAAAAFTPSIAPAPGCSMSFW